MVFIRTPDRTFRNLRAQKSVDRTNFVSLANVDRWILRAKISKRFRRDYVLLGYNCEPLYCMLMTKSTEKNANEKIFSSNFLYWVKLLLNAIFLYSTNA